METPLVTVVIVAHTVRRELERCLASLDRYGGVPLRTILVDNASTDDTRAWVARAHPEVTVISLPENMGVAARDHGLRLSTTPYTMFMDSDAALTADALPRMVDALDGCPGWGLIGPRLVYDDGTVQPSCRRYPPVLLPVLRRPPLGLLFEQGSAVRHHLMLEADHSCPRSVLYVLGACQLFRTSLAQLAGPFDDRVFLGWDDADWCIRIRDAGGDVVYFPEATVIHSYRRLTQRRPVSLAAWRQLNAHVYFQWKYRRRRRELIHLSAQLDERSVA